MPPPAALQEVVVSRGDLYGHKRLHSPSWAPLNAILRLSFASWWSSWGSLEVPGCSLGGLLSPNFQDTKDLVGVLNFGSFQTRLGPCWGHFGALRGSSLANLEVIFRIFLAIFENLGGQVGCTATVQNMVAVQALLRQNFPQSLLSGIICWHPGR